MPINSYNELLEYLEDKFVENSVLGNVNKKERLVYIMKFIEKTSNMSFSLYTQIPGNNHTEKSVFILEELDIRLEKYIQNKEDKIVKQKNDFFLIIADNTKPSDCIEFIQNIVPDKNVVIIEKENHKNVSKNKIDLILFTGGSDVSPDFYNEKVGKYTHIDKNRDIQERDIYEQYYNIPKLGICRGAQFLTVVAGGKLIQHVEGHNKEHRIRIVRDGRYLPTSSSHHQMMFPFLLNKDDYEMIAYSEYYESNTYLNGENKEIEKPLTFVEAEIINYPKHKSLCIQGHPEWMDKDAPFVRETIKLIKNLLLKNEK